MRSRIKIEGKWYRPVPWLVHGECKGCNANKPGVCINEATNACDTGGEFDGHILIEHNKEALAKYIARKLLPPEDND